MFSFEDFENAPKKLADEMGITEEQLEQGFAQQLERAREELAADRGGQESGTWTGDYIIVRMILTPLAIALTARKLGIETPDETAFTEEHALLLEQEYEALVDSEFSGKPLFEQALTAAAEALGIDLQAGMPADDELQFKFWLQAAAQYEHLRQERLSSADSQNQTTE